MGAIEKTVAQWQVVKVAKVVTESPTATSLMLELSKPIKYYAGQHLELRLTAANGYQAVRDYSIASAPSASKYLEVTVQAIPSGEVSGYIHDQIKVGDQLEVNAPLGYHFIWTDDLDGPITLIGGGSGIVPLMSIWREAHANNQADKLNMLYSVRKYDDILYKPELWSSNGQIHGVHLTLVEQQPVDWTGYRRRVDEVMIAEVCGPLDVTRRFFICGPTPMVEGVSGLLLQMGYDASLIKTERFGPTGAAQNPSPVVGSQA